MTATNPSTAPALAWRIVLPHDAARATDTKGPIYKEAAEGELYEASITERRPEAIAILGGPAFKWTARVRAAHDQHEAGAHGWQTTLDGARDAAAFYVMAARQAHAAWGGTALRAAMRSNVPPAADVPPPADGETLQTSEVLIACTGPGAGADQEEADRNVAAFLAHPGVRALARAHGLTWAGVVVE